jgi:uracil-DNA glycosylase
MSIKNLSNEWNDLLKEEFLKPYYPILTQKINDAYKTETIFPPASQVFNALKFCSFSKIRVVIIGQDPYHGYGQAHGLSFSVNKNLPIPPSLKNIYKELASDVPEFTAPQHGNLESWASQGVLLLNAILTVKQASPGSHKNFGWENFTNAVIKLISGKKENIVFLLWGNFAISKAELINTKKHLVLTAAHPSPLARGAFFGSKHFSKTNQYLIENGFTAINWKLP